MTPVWPIIRSRSTHPASVATRVAPTSAPSFSASRSICEKFPWVPRPPTTIAFAFVRSTVAPFGSNATRRAPTSLSVREGTTFVSSPFGAPASGAANTPGRTVTICGRWTGHETPASIPPPKPGTQPTRIFRSSSSIEVTCAVRPVRSRIASRPARSCPFLVAPKRSVEGSAFFISEASAVVYAFASYVARSGWAISSTWSAPYSRSVDAAPPSAPRVTVVRGTPTSSASARPLPSSSKLTGVNPSPRRSA